MVKLVKGHEVLIDGCDEALFDEGRWCVRSDGYVEGYLSGKRGLLHRLILCPRKGECVDHINHITLDNRRENLRICSYAENGANRWKQSRKTTSTYKGVYWHKSMQMWQVRIQAEGQRHCLGYYNIELVAALIYDRAGKTLFGDFASPQTRVW